MKNAAPKAIAFIITFSEFLLTETRTALHPRHQAELVNVAEHVEGLATVTFGDHLEVL